MATLKDVWLTIAGYLSDGISVIPVHDQGDRKKTPYAGWKYFQKHIATPDVLFHEMDKHGTNAAAIICGEVSGNLEVIDVDVKNWQGIDALFLNAIREVLPNLFDQLRLHRTPSGGMHLLYRIADHPAEGNKKLAYAEGAKLAAIETRGEGGYVLAPPSLDYFEVHPGRPIPTITWDERCALIALACGFNTKVQVKREKRPSRNVDEYYSTNPFDHFNQSDAAEEVLGWKYLRKSGNYLYFTRPGKDTGVSASFDLERRFYYIHTSSTELEPSRGYSPSAILAITQHGGDFKRAYAWLVQNGYGVAKPDKEAERAERLARSGKQPAPNFTEAGLQLHAAVSAKLADQHPYGTFWQYNAKSETHKISREALQTVAAALGFRLYRDELHRVAGHLLNPSQTREFIDVLKDYIKEEDAEIREDICNCFESFMQNSCEYTVTRLPIISRDEVLSDTKTTAYKCYLNGIATITAEGISFDPYSPTPLIHSSRLLQRNFILNPDAKGKFADFIVRATGGSESVLKTIGYLCHDFRDETQGYIIVLSETCPDPQMGGGSGKSLFCSLLSHSISVCLKNASQVQYDEKFFGSWNFERIFVCGDAPKSFKFEFLKEPATGQFTYKRLWKDPVEVPAGDGPKFIVSTNFSFVNLDGGMERRIMPLEFTPFFNRERSVDGHYGCHFPSGWSADDWENYDNAIAACIQLWLASPRLQSPHLSAGGWEKQMKQTHGEVTFDFVNQYFESWVSYSKLSPEDLRRQLRAYLDEQGVPVNYHPSIRRVIMCIKDTAKERAVKFTPNHVNRVNSVSMRVHLFGNGDQAKGDDLEF